MAIGIERAILLETDGRDWDPVATAGAIVEAIRAQEAADGPFDLILFGNESADSGGFQVGIRVAAALGRPSSPASRASRSVATRSSPGARRPAAAGRSFELPLPAVVVGQGGDQPAALPVGAGPAAGEARRRSSGSTPGVAAGRPREDRPPPAEGGGHARAEVIGRGAGCRAGVVDLLAAIGVLDR